jgi:EmrB/QacA subfamily drug resistance transporter
MTPDPRTLRWVLGLASVASFMVALDTLVVSTALTTIRQDLGASVADLEWTVNAYNLTFAVLLLPAAALGDRLGRRRVFAAGLVAFSLASAACAVAPDVTTLIIARAIQGAGAAFVMPLALALVGAVFPPERRGAAMGAMQGLTGLSVAAGPVIGGAIAQGIDWPWIFWLNVPIGLIAAPLVLARIPESVGDRSAARIDLRGVVLITLGALGIVWGLVRGNDAGWGSAEVLGSLAAGALFTAAFVRAQIASGDAALLPPRLFAKRAFSAGNTANFLLVASLFSAVFFFAQYQQTGLGQDPLHAGIRLLPWTATLFFVAPIAGKLVDKFGERPFLVTGLTMQGAGLLWVALIADPGLEYYKMIPALMIAGCGVSMAFPAVMNAVTGAVSPQDMGKAAGTNSMLRELGGVFGIAICVAVFAGAGSYASAQAFVDGFAPAIGTSAGLALLGAAIALLVPARAPAPLADAAVAPAAVPQTSASTS